MYATRGNNFMDWGFVAPYYKIFTMTHIHILPQNNCHLLRFKSTEVSIAAGNTAVQGCCHGTTASFFRARAQDAYNKVNCIGGQALPCSFACLQLLLLG
jgi:hypothetical protein